MLLVFPIEADRQCQRVGESKPQGVVRIKWTAYNQDGEAVYTFNPIGIVPRRPE